MVRAVLPLASLVRDDPDGARHLVREARAALRDAPWPQAVAVATDVEVLVLRLASDDGHRARHLAGLRRDFPRGLGSAQPSALWSLSVGISATWAGELELVGDLARRIDDAPSPIRWRASGRAWLRGLVAERRGDLRGAADALRSAQTAGLAGLTVHEALLNDDLCRVLTALDDTRGAVDARRRAELLLADGARFLRPHEPDPLAVLSEREREVVHLLAEGLSYEQIAGELFVSRSTVAFHLSKAYAKTNTSSRHELTRLMRSR